MHSPRAPLHFCPPRVLALRYPPLGHHINSSGTAAATADGSRAENLRIGAARQPAAGGDADRRTRLAAGGVRPLKNDYSENP
jgi:hypothetical protein